MVKIVASSIVSDDFGRLGGECFHETIIIPNINQELLILNSQLKVVDCIHEEAQTITTDSSCDGTRFATVTENSVTLWDLAGNRITNLYATNPHGFFSPLCHAKFSPNGSILWVFLALEAPTILGVSTSQGEVLFRRKFGFEYPTSFWWVRVPESNDLIFCFMDSDGEGNCVYCDGDVETFFHRERIPTGKYNLWGIHPSKRWILIQSFDHGMFFVENELGIANFDEANIHKLLTHFKRKHPIRNSDQYSFPSRMLYGKDDGTVFLLHYEGYLAKFDIQKQTFLHTLKIVNDSISICKHDEDSNDSNQKIIDIIYSENRCCVLIVPNKIFLLDMEFDDPLKKSRVLA
jgi:hypothetical protein